MGVEIGTDAQAHAPHVMREEAERLRAVMESAPNAVVVVDGRGRIVITNSEADRMFGYGRMELIGETIEVLIPMAARGRHTHLRERFVAQERTRPMGTNRELVALRKDGTEFPVEVGLGWLQTDAGVLITSAIADITARKQAEASISRLAAIVQSADEAIVGETLEGTITAWNAAAERIYGFLAEEVIGRHVSMLCPSVRHEEEVGEILVEITAGRIVEQFETTRRRKDGRLIDISLSASPVRDAEGRVTGVCAVVRDISERRKAANALAEAEERFRGAFEEAPIGMTLLDARGHMTKVNRALCEITGREAPQLEGIRCSRMLQRDDAGQLSAGLRALRSGQQMVYTGELRLAHACGHPVWTALQATLIHDADGKPRRFLVQIQDITDRKRYEQRLQEMADHDALTGLLNRRSFTRELDSQAALAARYGPEGALLMLDLDNFKRVNDTLGHQAGDEIILRSAQLLAGRLRVSDKIARLGGDEFAILLPKADAVAAERVARQLLDVLTLGPITVGMTTRTVTASIGIATFERDLSGQEVLVNADRALYDAKEAGRNGFSSFRSANGKPGPMKGDRGWFTRIQEALEDGRFTLLAQPIVDYGTGQVTQHEVLLRMIDEQGELIAPATLLYVAERLDLIHEIDAWMIRETMRLFSGSVEGSAGRPVIHVNLSGRSLGDVKLLDLVERQLEENGGAAPQLTFEVSETAAVSYITHAQRFGERLAELGCRFALDDFGAGFGSFYYLKHLPFDFLKIDAEFVRHCTRSNTDRLVIEAVVGIARGLGKRTIAEGVEDEDTVTLLKQLGVDFGQGSHHGCPTTAGLLRPGGTA